MPVIDEDTLRELMHRSTCDLHAPAEIAVGVVARQRRRHWRHRAAGVTAAGLAAGTVAGVVAAGTAAPARPARPVATSPRHHAAATPRLQLTAAQRTLYHLSSVAARLQPADTGRYVAMSETGDIYRKTSVIDSRTGDVWTYQSGSGVPSELPVARHFSPTQAQFASWPTQTAALRRFLLHQGQQQQKQAERENRSQLLRKGAIGRKALKEETAQPQLPASGLIFQQAADTLWNPLINPALESALFRVLAATPGVTVNNSARDSRGRPAIEITMADTDYLGNGISVFENPGGHGVLELLYTYASQGPVQHSDSDVFLSIKRSATLPPNPYTHS
jgi:hypothetical protein